MAFVGYSSATPYLPSMQSLAIFGLSMQKHRSCLNGQDDRYVSLTCLLAEIKSFLLSINPTYIQTRHSVSVCIQNNRLCREPKEGTEKNYSYHTI